MDTGLDTVFVYTRPGNLVPMNDGGWALIKTFQVEGQGKGVVTSLPDFVYPFIIPAGQTQSFYIATNSTDIDFWYSDGSDLGLVFASNDDLAITEGYAIGHNWKGYASPRQWNGAVHYTVLADDPTASPVVQPTDVPTASPVEPTGPTEPTEPAVSSTPSAAPSIKVCQYVSRMCIHCVFVYSTDKLVMLISSSHLIFPLQPSSYPSLLPTSGFASPTADTTATTQSPTKRPTKQPTKQPTQSEPTASAVPTTTNFKEPRSGTTQKPTGAPVASSSRRATYSTLTSIACLSLAITKTWFLIW